MEGDRGGAVPYRRDEGERMARYDKTSLFFMLMVTGIQRAMKAVVFTNSAQLQCLWRP